jgi:hypothetical protein
MQKLTLTNLFHHLRTVQTHRKWVRHYCFLAGIPWRGIKHDLSKYSPVEFFESAHYWNGTSSPINEAKKQQGISYGWMHHKGRNTHHYEYWMDNFDDGGIARLMPQNDFVELVCDYLGAARAYQGNNFTYSNEYKWWIEKRKKCAMNGKNKVMLDIIFSDLEIAENPMLAGLTRKEIKTPEQLIKSGYIQEIWRVNS